MALGGWLAMPTSIAAEAMAALDLDYVCVDTQHGLVGYDASVPMLQAITLGTATPVVRVPWNEPGSIGKALDAGAMAVIVPMINDADEAGAALSATRYPPAGGRSFGPGRAQPVEGDDYFERANIDVACIPMIETSRGVERIDDILTIEGVDAIYVGPADLAVSLGEVPRTNGPALNEALDRIVAACRQHGVVPGIHGSADLLPQRVEQGFRMVTVVSDLVALRVKLAADVAQARGLDAEASNSLY